MLRSVTRTVGVFAATALALIVLVIGSVAVWFATLSKGEVEDYLSQNLGRSVTLSDIETRWDGIVPQLRASSLSLQTDSGSAAAVELTELRMRVELGSLLQRKLVFEELILVEPKIEVLRGLDGTVVISGFESLGAVADGSATAFWRWLSVQSNLQVQHGRLVWRDLSRPDSELELSPIQIHLDGADRRVLIKLNSDNELAHNFQAVIELGEDTDSPDFGPDTISFQAKGIDLAAAQKVLAMEELEKVRGLADVDLELSFAGEQVSAFHGPIMISSAHIPVPGQYTPLEVELIRGSLRWANRATGWDLDIENVQLSGQDRPWFSGDLNIARNDGSIDLLVSTIDLGELKALLGVISERSELLQAIARFSPAGTVDNLEIHLPGGWSSPETFSIAGEVDRLALSPYESHAGVTGLSGRFAVSEQGGELVIGGEEVSVSLPRLLREPLRLLRPKGRIMVQRDAEQWVITGKDIQLANTDISAAGQFTLRRDSQSDRSPHLQLSARFEGGDIKQAPRYYPAKIMSPKLLRWLETALGQGTVTDGFINIDGRLADFPFINTEGKFEVVANIVDGLLNYVPGWPPLEAARAQLRVENATMAVTGDTGIVGGLDITEATARIDNLRSRTPHLQIEGGLYGPFSLVVGFLRNGPLFQDTGLSALKMTGTGNGLLNLSLDLPIKELSTSKVLGSYDFDGSGLAFANGIVVSDLDGILDFTEAEVHGQGLTGRVLGGESQFSVKTIAAGAAREVLISAAGEFAAPELEILLGSMVADSLSGSAKWVGDITLVPGRAKLHLESDLHGVIIDLPGPVGKAAGHVVSSAADIDYRSAGTQNTGFRIGDRINGALVYKRDGPRWRLSRGEVVVGAKPARVPYGTDLHVGVYVAELDLDQWFKAFDKTPSDVDGTPSSVPVRRIHGDVGALTAFGRAMGALRFSADQGADQHWQATVDGGQIKGAGDIWWATGERRVRLEFERLYLSKADTASGESSKDPRGLPGVDIVAADFRYDRMELGALEMHAGPTQQGWNIRQLDMSRPDLDLTISGDWNYDGERHRSSFRGKFLTPDLGSALGALGFAEQIENGEALIEVNLEWEGSPGRFDFAHLNGGYLISAKDGRFLKVNPGSGRFVGLLNTDALVRRLNLDFSDVFAKGLTFDEMSGAGSIYRGDLYMDGVFIAGPATLIELTGRTGLAKEDFDLELVVAPQVGGNLSLIGGVLTGPAFGALIFLAQKVFKKQLGKLVRYKYEVTGPWSQPDIERIRQLPAAEREEFDSGDK